MKNAFYVQQYNRRHLLGWSDTEQWKNQGCSLSHYISEGSVSYQRDLLRDKNFKEAAPMLFGENFCLLAKDRLEAALTKALSIDKPCSDFHKGHS